MTKLEPEADAASYDQDFYAWTAQQAALLRAGAVSQLDLEHLAEEIETLGRSERRELVSQLAVLLLHLLKWSYQPERQGKSWRLTIVEQREQVAAHLHENPSLRAILKEAVADAYRSALTRAERETGLLRNMFPWTCPYTSSQILAGTFWPEPA